MAPTAVPAATRPQAQSSAAGTVPRSIVVSGTPARAAMRGASVRDPVTSCDTPATRTGRRATASDHGPADRSTSARTGPGSSRPSGPRVGRSVPGPVRAARR
ncbi:hypothetical protein JOD57_004482 [Geodermatophilus bullaregiensis]|uniref:hypothetical protein n=1 Tax=Geodermatophilus bullaregiensis TaxID=1564160 RepID=UPI00195CBA6C|nr:hypothetical protein [Geodermatophilus bullaregiensis]MBM7808645.1 hypothetical protein [Geodermatophilus bullaregiensis]